MRIDRVLWSSRSVAHIAVRFPRHTMDRLREVASARGVGVTQLIREWTEQRLDAGGNLNDRALLADELERAARFLRDSA